MKTPTPQQSIRDVLEKNIDAIREFDTLIDFNSHHPQSTYYYKDISRAMDKATQELLNIINGLIPEEHVCTDECKINSREWIIGHKAYKDAEHNIISEIRERLKR